MAEVNLCDFRCTSGLLDDPEQVISPLMASSSFINRVGVPDFERFL